MNFNFKNALCLNLVFYCVISSAILIDHDNCEQLGDDFEQFISLEVA